VTLSFLTSLKICTGTAGKEVEGSSSHHCLLIFFQLTNDDLNPPNLSLRLRETDLAFFVMKSAKENFFT
jgi:hypothetical protein